MLQTGETVRIEDLVVAFHDIFARHCFNKGMIEHLRSN